MEYKCPCCGGAIKFDSSIQKMKCPYCDTEFDMDTLKSMDEELKKTKEDHMKWDTKPRANLGDDDEQSIRSYICNSCGGEIIADENTVATKCPFCDNPIVMTEQVKGMLKPDYVIPFKLDKKAAKAALASHLKGKKLLPKVFKDENHIDEIKGVYIPFWLFDTGVDASMRYRATKVRTWSDSNYNYTETNVYSAFREGNLDFENVPVDGSTRIPDELMESIEPFDFKEAVDFQTAYLAGYLADKYDVTSGSCEKNANSRIKNTTEEMFKDTVEGYTTVSTDCSSVRFHNTNTKYALYPVWILNTTWNGKKYMFAMNGQTGKFVGDLPLDKKAYYKMLGIYTAIFSVVVYGIEYIMNII